MNLSTISSERFSSRNQSRKIRIERMIADQILFSVENTWRLRQNGVPVVSLVGPNLKRHYRTYSELFGKNSLYVVERRLDIYKKQFKQSRKFPTVKFCYGDFFDFAIKYTKATNSQRVFFDYDACRTFSMQTKEEKLLYKFKLLAEAIHKQPLPKLKKIWLACTFSCRREKLTANQIANKIIGLWKKQGFKPEMRGLYSYRDGCPMYEMLFEINS